MREVQLKKWLLCALVGCSSEAANGIVNVHDDSAVLPGLDATADSGVPASDSAVGDSAVPPTFTRYVTTARHSPFAEPVIAKLKAVLAGGTRGPHAFSKMGASNTVNTGFLSCFAGNNVKLENYASLEPTRAWFGAPLPDGTSAYSRVSEAATVGWRAVKVVEGSPNAATKELTETNASFALITLGTNDSFEGGLDSFDRNIRKLIDQLLTMHVVPVLSTVPPRTDSIEADRLAREINALIWLAGETYQVPVVNIYDALTPLGDGALLSDGIHLSVYTSSGSKGCWFTPEALKKGHNTRNLLTLEALDRAKRFLLESEAAEAAVAKLVGSGTLVDPIVIENFPFAAEGDTKNLTSTIDSYSCGSQNESGGEIVYRFTVTKRGTVRFRVLDDDGVDVDLQLLTAADPKACKKRSDSTLEDTLEPGTYWLVVDTFNGSANAGKFRLSAIEF